MEYRYRDESLTFGELRALEAECFPDDALSQKQFEDRASSGFWTAREDRALIGYLLCGSRGEGTHVVRLAVCRASRRRGVGTELLRLAAGQARQEGAPCLTLCVLEGNAGARALYRKIGFIETGHAMRRYSVKPCDIPAAKPLGLVREGEGYKYALRFQKDGADAGGGQYNEEIGGVKDFTLANPREDLPGALRALCALLKPEQGLLYAMTDDPDTIAACEESPLRLWSAILDMRMAL